MDNRAGRFASLDAVWPLGPVPLSAVLRTVVARGGTLAVVLRDAAHNRSFLERLRILGRAFPGKVKIALASDFHEKGIVGSDYDLSGSMNLTHRGVEVNDEHLIFRTDRATVAARRLTLDAHWRSRLHACG